MSSTGRAFIATNLSKEALNSLQGWGWELMVLFRRETRCGVGPILRPPLILRTGYSLEHAKSNERFFHLSDRARKSDADSIPRSRTVRLYNYLLEE